MAANNGIKTLILTTSSRQHISLSLKGQAHE
jgi:hypothetical protein